jgi:hypothetical protein
MGDENEQEKVGSAITEDFQDLAEYIASIIGILEDLQN